MMRAIKGPAIFLAQFAGDAAPYDSLPSLARWAAGHGYRGVQVPTWDARLFDLARAAESVAYCDEVKGVLDDAGVELTELSTHLQGQLVAVLQRYRAAILDQHTIDRELHPLGLECRRQRRIERGEYPVDRAGRLDSAFGRPG